jgi:O-antigen/teichoic acid export membrane protein
MIDQVEVQDDTQGQTQQRVARNAGIYLIVQLISWCVTFVGLSIVPRTLGEQVNGELVLASSTLILVFSFGSFCIDSFLMREIGRDSRQADKLVRATLGLRILTFLIVGPIGYIVLCALHPNAIVISYGLMLLPSVFINSLNDPLRSALLGSERAREVSLSDLCIISAPLFAIPFLHYGATALIVIGTGVQVITLLLRRRWLRNVLSMRPIFNLRLWLHLIRGGIPFMMNIYVGMFYSYLTLLVLNHFMKEAAVGEYNQASRLMGTFLVVPTVLSSALLPVLTRMADMDPKAFAQAKIRVLVVLIVSCLPIIVGVILLAQPLCHLLYKHKFVHVPEALQMGALLLLPLYVINVTYQFLVAQKRNGIWSSVLLGTVILNTALAWFLVPYTMRTLNNGIVGATVANTVAEFAAMSFAFFLLRINPFAPALLDRVLRGAAATAVMALVIWKTRQGLAHLPLPFTLSNALQLFVPAVLGAGVFLVLAGLLKAFPPQEQELVVKALRRKLRRAA